jgi:hypothetical protein
VSGLQVTEAHVAGFAILDSQFMAHEQQGSLLSAAASSLNPSTTNMGTWIGPDVLLLDANGLAILGLSHGWFLEVASQP